MIINKILLNVKKVKIYLKNRYKNIQYRKIIVYLQSF